MLIYEQEKIDNISLEKLEKLSISIASIAEPATLPTKHSINSNFKSLASFNDEDLYYVQSILVSSSWNKNDDIFTKEEVWAAKKTPEDKPTNLDHDENMIIGHIVSNWPITTDGILIDELTPLENIPEKFHIITGSVIYKSYMGEELKERSNKLIAEIEDGTKYVSMECMFKGFDYGLIDITTGDYKILSRSEETAFLTKHLRAYGGTGEYDNNKIGRVLRNITFSGKGYVDKPANPDSIIFTKDVTPKNSIANISENFANLLNIGVSNIQSTLNVEKNTMSLNETQAELVAEVMPAVEETVTEVVTETTNTEANIESLTQRITELETQVVAQLEVIKTLETEKEEAANKMKKVEKEDKEEETEAAKKTKQEMAKKEEEMKKVKSELDSALEAIAGYKMKEEEMAKKEKKMKRKASLVDNGFDAESAETVVEKFETMADDAFDAMTSLFAGKMPPWLEKIKKGDDEEDKKTKEKKKASENSADPGVLDTVEVEAEVNLVGIEI